MPRALRLERKGGCATRHLLILVLGNLWHETGAVGVPGFINFRARLPYSVTWSYALRLAVSLREI